MAVQFIVGRAGAGKSHYLYEKLIEKSLKYRNKNFIAIVPEQEFYGNTEADSYNAS